MVSRIIRLASGGRRVTVALVIEMFQREGTLYAKLMPRAMTPVLRHLVVGHGLPKFSLAALDPVP